MPDDHLLINRRLWERTSDAYQERHAAQLSLHEPGWGVWQIPESELQVLGDVRGKEVLELGCGAAQWSICLARRGADAVGLDFTSRQLHHARRLVTQEDVAVRLFQASAESVPLRDAAFDIVFCDFGAMTFADPRRTVPEVARLLRPGGLFAFSTGTPLLSLCAPGEVEIPGDRLLAGYWEIERDVGEGILFQLPYGEWIRLFRANSLSVEDLIEPRPPAGATSTYRGAEELAWARRWPAELIWKLRRERPDERL